MSGSVGNRLGSPGLERPWGGPSPWVAVGVEPDLPLLFPEGGTAAQNRRVGVRRDFADVLLVEDDASIRVSLAEILEDEGYRVAVAAHGGVALDILRSSGSVRLILLDLMMPIMNGWEFRAALRADLDLSRIPTVVVTGDGAVSRDAKVLGVNDYLLKPIDVDRLLRVVARYCR